MQSSRVAEFLTDKGCPVTFKVCFFIVVYFPDGYVQQIQEIRSTSLGLHFKFADRAGDASKHDA